LAGSPDEIERKPTKPLLIASLSLRSWAVTSRCHGLCHYPAFSLPVR
ncbi:hypothetical protein WN51_00411, partial [Melipona quadrifasciata]